MRFLQSDGSAVLLGQFCPTVLLVRERAGRVCQDTILESKGLRAMPLSSVSLLYDGVVSRLGNGQRARVYLELLGF